MRERPLLFSPPMSLAIREARKTQTRRVVKCQTGDLFDVGALVGAVQERRPVFDAVAQKMVGTESALIRCPQGVPGDRIWGRESGWVYGVWNQDGENARGRPRWRFQQIGQSVRYENPGPEKIGYWGGPQGWVYRPSIHMPRWTSRLLLDVVDVRVERLQDCSAEDAKAEGLEWVSPTYGISGIADSWSEDPVAAYRALWDHINGETPGAAWRDNPWVWVIEFKRLPTNAAQDAATTSIIGEVA